MHNVDRTIKPDTYIKFFFGIMTSVCEASVFAQISPINHATAEGKSMKLFEY